MNLKTKIYFIMHSQKSYSENNNEKLILGDRVLGLIISKKPLDKYPNEKRG